MAFTKKATPVQKAATVAPPPPPPTEDEIAKEEMEARLAAYPAATGPGAYIQRLENMGKIIIILLIKLINKK